MHLTCVSHFEPSWESWADYARQRDEALLIDALRSTRPIEFPVRRPDEAEAMFDVLTYQKGASVLRMIEQHVGAERFREGVRRYLRAHLFANAETSDLWEAIGEVVSDASIRPLMDSWVFRGGVPLVEVNRQEDTIVLSQRRFLLLDEGPQETDARDGHGGGADANWLIPMGVEYRNGGNSGESAPARLVLGPEPIRLAAQAADSGASLLVANAGGHGYYRTRYDSESFGKLLASFPRLEGLEQLVLASDTWSCVLAGIGQLEEFLSVTAKLDENCEPAVWRVVHDSIMLLDRAVSEADRPVLRSWCSALMSPVLERLGWRAFPGESPRRSAARSILIRDLGVIAGDALVVERARASFERWFSDRDTADPGTWGAILAVVASAGGRAEFEVFRARYERPSSPQERRRNLDALSGFESPSWSRRYFRCAWPGCAVRMWPTCSAECSEHPTGGGLPGAISGTTGPRSSRPSQRSRSGESWAGCLGCFASRTMGGRRMLKTPGPSSLRIPLAAWTSWSSRVSSSSMCG